MNRKSVALTALGVAVCAVGLYGVANAQLSTEKPRASPGKERGDLTWGTCDRPDLPVQKGVECGTLKVPVDWAEPQSETVALRAYRWKAADQSKRKGTILNFPSGPGEAGDIAFADLRQHLPGYDLIALDPRGVEQSAPLNCTADKALKIPQVPPTDSRRFHALAKDQSSFWSTCATAPAGLKNHMDAYSNARDAEALRKAMRLERINVHGFSYGTLTAERYLGLYGDHVNGSVLESVMDPTQSRRAFVTSAARGMEAIFDRFGKWCAKETSCALHGKDVASVFRTAQKKADAGQIPGSLHSKPWSAATVTGYFEVTAPSSFKEAAEGLKKLSEGKNPMPGEGKPGQDQTPKSVPFPDPIVCSDFDLSAGTVGQARHDLKATRKAAPVLGFSTNASHYTATCLSGPRPAEGSSKPVTSRSDHPTMLLSNTLDPATPHTWADRVAGQLRHKAVPVKTDQVGHGGGLDDPQTKRKVVAYMDQANRAGR
ncbi:alpha/beta fold hydrolase [Streptomyces niphimycinicus]|uniref:alpha/beta fold hydrolase n=2 Tax=Bacteria TaxID=2 RepID=UPI00209B2A8F|nr:alpha/beta fold hydrolase [Streptomyces niphimycinicus]